MKVKVILFAGLREKMGKGEIVLELPADCTLSALQNYLKIEPQTWSSLAFAVNENYVPSNTRLAEGDEAALIPPMAGG